MRSTLQDQLDAIEKHLNKNFIEITGETMDDRLTEEEIEAVIQTVFEYASQFREPSTQGGEEKIFLDSESTYSLMTSSDPEKVEKGKVLRVQELALQLVKKNKRIQVLEEALKQIRHKTYSRDTDDSILHEIDSVLTDVGFPYQSED